MNKTTMNDDPDDLHRIAVALERIADHLAPPTGVTRTTINLTGNYAGTKNDLAKSVVAAIRDAENRGTLDFGWRKAE